MTEPKFCRQCGQQRVGGEQRCSVCGDVEFQEKCVLISQATNYRIEMRVQQTDVGKAILATTGCGDCVYATEPQFHVVKDLRLGGWAIQPNRKAKNPTYLNGKALVEAALLKGGDRISIGPTKMLLLVEL